MGDNLTSWLLKGAFATAITIAVAWIAVSAYHSYQNSNYADDINQIVSSIEREYTSAPYTQGAAVNATATLISTGEVPSSWAGANGTGAATPWNSQWLFQVSSTTLQTTIPGIPLESCLAVVRGLNRTSRLATVNLNGTSMTVSAVPMASFPAALNDLATYCTAGNGNQLILTLS